MDREGNPLEGLEEHEALKLILEGTSRETGRRFFPAFPLKAAAVAAAVIGSALLWQTGGDVISSQFDTGLLHALTGGGE